MSQVLSSIPNIKIPYPIEGVVRTAQLDDTVAPEDSVQIAVNMNFDRVGALQTRLGVTQYADDLDSEVLNYGTLRNVILEPGYETLTLLGEKSTIADVLEYPSAAKIDDEHVIVFFRGTDGDGFVQVMETSLTTGGLVPLGTPLEFDTTNGDGNVCIQVDATHFLNIWTGSGNDGYAQVFTVNTSTWAVTANGTALEFDASEGVSFGIAQIDSNHFLLFYNGVSDGQGTVLEVNLSTYAVTEPGATLTTVTGGALYNSLVPLGDGEHFIAFMLDIPNNDGIVQCFNVNTGTWAITALDTPLIFDANGSFDNTPFSLGDGEHFVNFYYSGAGGGYARVFEVDTASAYEVTEVGTALNFATGLASEQSGASMGDDEHFYLAWQGSGSIMYSQLFNVDPSTYAVTAIGSPLEFGDEGTSDDSTTVKMSDYRVITIWANVDDEGNGQMFRMDGDYVFGRWLYAGEGDEIFNWEGSTWTSRRSGLATVSKPRFSQYLGYIWMVNGNSIIGGDPVATSNGGDFGTDLVPDGFPQGDFIHAGFEGRVWVADKEMGIIYYTDIVQFTPPDVYSLTYNSEVNFITNLTPQTGQQITALYRVPRALLVFTEDSIFRIYGASSVDAYPAYNVGTYSQESIVETKTGIFFHHSSGFYQFDYGSQPVEISRRIIDFVKAIPRAQYDDITGVYDGFDAVEWAVGQVTVEGVVFANCVLRYTISTQVWTIYDYPNNVITAMISYDDGTDLVHLMGTQAGKTGSMDTGYTDFGEGFYFEYIDRWRSFTDMYYQVKAISGFNIYSENAAGANLSYQEHKAGPNAWKPIATVTEAGNSLTPNDGTDEFNVLRLRLAGNTSGAQVVVHGIEITELEIRGQETN